MGVFLSRPFSGISLWYLFKHLLYNKSSQLVCYCLVTKLCTTPLQSHGLKLTRLLCPWDFPGKNTRVGCHTPLQGIFPTQGSNLCLLHWQADSSLLSHQGSPLANWSDCLQNRTIWRRWCVFMDAQNASAGSHTAVEPPTLTSWEIILRVFYLWWVIEVYAS